MDGPYVTAPTVVSRSTPVFDIGTNNWGLTAGQTDLPEQLRPYQVGRVEAERAPTTGVWAAGALVWNMAINGSGRGRLDLHRRRHAGRVARERPRSAAALPGSERVLRLIARPVLLYKATGTGSRGWMRVKDVVSIGSTSPIRNPFQSLLEEHVRTRSYRCYTLSAWRSGDGTARAGGWAACGPPPAGLHGWAAR